MLQIPTAMGLMLNVATSTEPAGGLDLGALTGDAEAHAPFSAATVVAYCTLTVTVCGVAVGKAKSSADELSVSGSALFAKSGSVGAAAWSLQAASSTSSVARKTVRMGTLTLWRLRGPRLMGADSSSRARRSDGMNVYSRVEERQLGRVGRTGQGLPARSGPGGQEFWERLLPPLMISPTTVTMSMAEIR